MPKLSPTYRMQFKRRRLGKTNYRKRLKFLESKKPRLVVRKSLRYITAQIVEYGEKGDKTVLSAFSRQLKKIGWNFACDTVPAAYLTGLALGKIAKQKGIAEVILDIGLQTSTKGSRVYAVARGVVDSGVKVEVGEGVFPSEDRISGKHLASHQQKLKDLPSVFEKVKGIITKGV